MVYSVTTPFTLNSVPTLVQAPLAVHLDTSLYGAEATREHWDRFVNAMGRQPAVLGGVGANAFNGFPEGSPPNLWGSGDLTKWLELGIPNTVTPLLSWAFTDGTRDNAFAAYANAKTTRYPAGTGQTYEFWIQNSIKAWRDAGITKMYIRINWEFQSSSNTGGPVGGFGVGTIANLPVWRNAWRGFANAAKSVPGIEVRMVWCPATTNTRGEPAVPPLGQPLMAYFPTVSGAASDGFVGGAPVGGQFIDVVGPDHYAFGGGTGFCYPEQTTPEAALDDIWYFTRCVEIAQQQNCTIAISEIGDFHTSTMDAWVDWIPNHFVGYMNTLRSLQDGAVPIEYVAFWDVNAGGIIPFSNLAPLNSDLMGWRKCLGNVLPGQTPPPYAFTHIETVPITGAAATSATFVSSGATLVEPVAAGAVVGSVPVQPPGWSGTLSVTAPFTMNGDEVVTSTPLAAGTYPFTVTATP